NGRYDGSSRFPENNRWGFFPSASIAWVPSKERFFAPVKEVLGMDFLKLRASYGSLGNQGWDTYGYIPFMSSGQIGTILDGALPVGVRSPRPVSPSLTWEQVRTINGGVDAAFFKERLNISFDRYTRFT